jgi:Ca2+-binding EF-hand superfamily protein
LLKLICGFIDCDDSEFQTSTSTTEQIQTSNREIKKTTCDYYAKRIFTYFYVSQNAAAPSSAETAISSTESDNHREEKVDSVLRRHWSDNTREVVRRYKRENRILRECRNRLDEQKGFDHIGVHAVFKSAMSVKKILDEICSDEKLKSDLDNIVRDAPHLAYSAIKSVLGNLNKLEWSQCLLSHALSLISSATADEKTTPEMMQTQETCGLRVYHDLIHIAESVNSLNGSCAFVIDSWSNSDSQSISQLLLREKTQTALKHRVSMTKVTAQAVTRISVRSSQHGVHDMFNETALMLACVQSDNKSVKTLLRDKHHRAWSTTHYITSVSLHPLSIGQDALFMALNHLNFEAASQILVRLVRISNCKEVAVDSNQLFGTRDIIKILETRHHINRVSSFMLMLRHGQLELLDKTWELLQAAEEREREHPPKLDSVSHPNDNDLRGDKYCAKEIMRRMLNGPGMYEDACAHHAHVETQRLCECNGFDRNRQTAFHHAVRSQQERVVRWAIFRGGNICWQPPKNLKALPTDPEKSQSEKQSKRAIHERIFKELAEVRGRKKIIEDEVSEFMKENEEKHVKHWLDALDQKVQSDLIKNCLCAFYYLSTTTADGVFFAEIDDVVSTLHFFRQAELGRLVMTLSDEEFYEEISANALDCKDINDAKSRRQTLEKKLVDSMSPAESDSNKAFVEKIMIAIEGAKKVLHSAKIEEKSLNVSEFVEFVVMCRSKVGSAQRPLEDAFHIVTNFMSDIRNIRALDEQVKKRRDLIKNCLCAFYCLPALCPDGITTIATIDDVVSKLQSLMSPAQSDSSEEVGKKSKSEALRWAETEEKSLFFSEFFEFVVMCKSKVAFAQGPLEDTFHIVTNFISDIRNIYKLNYLKAAIGIRRSESEGEKQLQDLKKKYAHFATFDLKKKQHRYAPFANFVIGDDGKHEKLEKLRTYQRAFAIFDLDDDKKITIQELLQTLKEYGEKISDEFHFEITNVAKEVKNLMNEARKIVREANKFNGIGGDEAMFDKLVNKLGKDEETDCYMNFEEFVVFMENCSRPPTPTSAAANEFRSFCKNVVLIMLQTSNDLSSIYRTLNEGLQKTFRSTQYLGKLCKEVCVDKGNILYKRGDVPNHMRCVTHVRGNRGSGMDR